jgi:hypothetical protein
MDNDQDIEAGDVEKEAKHARRATSDEDPDPAPATTAEVKPGLSKEPDITAHATPFANSEVRT